MPTQEDMQAEYQRGGALGVAGEAAWGIAKFTAAQSTINMLAKGPRAGYHIPFTKSGPLGDLGRKAKWWGPGGRTFGKAIPADTMKFFERSGMFKGSRSFFGAGFSMRAASPVVGKKAASMAGMKFILGRVAGVVNPVVDAIFLGQMAWGATVGAYNFASKTVSKYRGLELGGYFPESQGSITSRQRAVQAITSSQLQARSAIGNEAMLFHR